VWGRLRAVHIVQIPGELFLRLSKDDAAMRAAAWESALGQALRLFGGPRGAALAAGDVAALVGGLAVQDLPRGGEIRSSGAVHSAPTRSACFTNTHGNRQPGLLASPILMAMACTALQCQCA